MIAGSPTQKSAAFAGRCRAAGFLDVWVETTKLRKKTVLAVHGIAP